MDIEERRKRIREYDSKPENKTKKKEYMKKYRIEYEQKNKDKISQRKRKYYLKNKNIINEKNKKWMNENKEKFKKYLENYYSNPKNIEKRKEISKKWYNSLDKKKYRKNKRKWHKEKYNNDLNFKIKRLLRSRIITAFNNFTKTGKICSAKKYGINYEKIIRYLVKIMPNDFNEKEYEIDHITACCFFDLTNPEEIKKCFAPENHQWLNKKEHRIKTTNDLRKFNTIKKISNHPNPNHIS